jgi:hypothetical protein
MAFMYRFPYKMVFDVEEQQYWFTQSIMTNAIQRN